MPKPPCNASRITARVSATLLAAVLLCWDMPAMAQTLTQDIPMTFGRVVMYDNSTPRDLRLLPGGGYNHDPGYYVFPGNEPQLGTFTINNQLQNHVMDITVDLASGNFGGGAADFELVNPFTVPAVVTTDGSGNATFQLGATLRSNGSGVTFSNGPYNSIGYSITVTPQ